MSGVFMAATTTMNKEQAKILLQRYRMGLCTPEEIIAIEAWYDGMANTSDWTYTDDDMQAFKTSVAKNIQLAIAEPKVKKLPIFIRVAVAAVLILSVGGYWLYETQQSKLTTNAAMATNDIAPGHSGAVLHLSNGTTIVLDSASNGALVKDGNMQVVKQDGSIAYQPLSQASETPVYNTINTANGRQWQLTLPDGSKAWLNAASSITYPLQFTSTERKVVITGEVYFEVKHNAAMPFKVYINNATGNDGIIEDIGTSFNVNAYADEAAMNTTLVEGSVKVHASQTAKGIIISPNQQALVDKNGSIKVIANANVEEALAWKNGSFYFNGADMPTIMKQVARWYDVEIVYEGAIPDGHYKGKPSRNLTAAQMLKVLEYSGIDFKIEGKKIIVKK